MSRIDSRNGKLNLEVCSLSFSRRRLAMSFNPIEISVIVPVYNNPRDLQECLSALIASSVRGSEIVVVDDGSTDDSPKVASEMGVCVLRLTKNSGQSAARNYGARQAQGGVLFFVDSDVVVMPGAINRVLTALKERPDVAAVFGSYDARPRSKGTVSQYRNLLHHFVHQKGNPDASTFWAGCGAIRHSVFDEVGGFDEKQFSGRVEDIELGYRLQHTGHRIVLDKGLQGTHLKKWTLRSMVWTDIMYRAIPWSRLILQSKKAPNDLNLKGAQRLSVVLAGLVVLFLFLAPLRLQLLELSAGALAGVILLNRDLYWFFFRQRGFLFTVACIPLHLLYYLYSGLTFLYVWFDFQVRGPVVTLPKAERRI